jgi:hypothetical protein
MWFRFALGFAGVCIAGASASANVVFYGVNNTNLVRFDMTASSVSVVGPLGVSLMEDCDFDGAGTLWGMRQGNAGGFPPTIVCQSYTINTTTGAALLVNNFATASLQSLAFRASNSTFYSVNTLSSATPSTSGHLVTDNMVAGSVATVAGVPTGLPGSFLVDALAFAPDGTLFGMKDTNPGGIFGSINYQLVRINLATGLGTVIGPVTGNSSNVFASLRFDPATGTAYTVDANNGNVYTVNTTTGAGSLLFAGGAAATGTRGLGYVPAPGAATAVGMGALLVIRRRRR